jgi:hypothetical protein
MLVDKIDLAHQQAANLVLNHHRLLAHFAPTTSMAPANGSDASRGKQVPVSIPPMTVEEEGNVPCTLNCNKIAQEGANS